MLSAAQNKRSIILFSPKSAYQACAYVYVINKDWNEFALESMYSRKQNHQNVRSPMMTKRGSETR